MLTCHSLVLLPPWVTLGTCMDYQRQGPTRHFLSPSVHPAKFRNGKLISDLTTCLNGLEILLHICMVAITLIRSQKELVQQSLLINNNAIQQIGWVPTRYMLA